MRVLLLLHAALLVLAAAPVPAEGAGLRDQPLIADHNFTGYGAVPDSVINIVQDSIKYHYAHTSHGGQLRDGLYVIENNDPDYAYAYENNTLPEEIGALCIFNGQQAATYITPDLYWSSAGGMDDTRALLAANSMINASMWAWCSELDYYAESDVQAYLDSISVLEAEFPGVTFIYMTGNAQGTGAEGYNRYLRNEQIRQFCRDNNRVLFDFADLDCWYFNEANGEWEQNTYSYEGADIPSEHPEFAGDETSHTTWESCEQKAKVLWRLSALLAGWSDPTDARRSSWGGLKSLYRKGPGGAD